MDNCCPHVNATENITLTNVTVKFLKPNLTSVLQPCDARIIRSFKSQYRKPFLELADGCIAGKIQDMNENISKILNFIIK